jgi:hypothetical protein
MPNNPEERIAQLAPSWRWPRWCLATDPVVEYAVEHGDPALRTQLIANYLETTANAYRSLADGAAKAAQIAGAAKSR